MPDLLANLTMAPSVESYHDTYRAMDGGLCAPDIKIANLYSTKKQFVVETLKAKLPTSELGKHDEGASFFLADLGEVYRQHVRWKKNLPRVKPFFGLDEKFPNLQEGLLICSSGKMQSRS